MTSILWRRLDTPGHDACRLNEIDGGWKLDGAAVFLDAGEPARLTYQIVCDLDWRTLNGQIDGWLGKQPVEYSITRTTGGVWTLNGAPVRGLESFVDLDLGFTPATNLTQLRRVALAEGQAADVPVVWLDIVAGDLTVLTQRYERRSNGTYWYEAPSANYKGLIEADSAGFIRRYPDLWEAETSQLTDLAQRKPKFGVR